jgi:hypothetical protein
MSLTPRDLADRYGEKVLTWFARLDLERPRGVLSALVELGLMSTDEQVAWQARWDRASVPPGPPPDDIAARAREVLEGQLDRPPEPPGDTPTEAAGCACTTLQAFQWVGAVSGVEHADYELRRKQVFPDRPRQPPPYAARRLRAAAIGPDVRHGGLRIISVELFGDRVLVRWHLVAPSNPDPSESAADDLVEAHSPAALEDAAGTRYTAVQPRSYELETRWIRGDPPVLLGTTAFVPGPPAQTIHLLVKSPAGKFEIDFSPPPQCPIITTGGTGAVERMDDEHTGENQAIR